METNLLLGENYIPRVVDTQVARALSISGAVLIEGPRGSGKTFTGLRHASSAVFLDDPKTQQLIDIDPQYPLQGKPPHLIDEWQLEPYVWNQVRRAVDRQQGFGQFILTGSAVPSDDITRHTGAARFLRIRERTMTWEEKGKSKPVIFFDELFQGQLPHTDPMQWSVEENIDALLTSGFPAQRKLSLEDAGQVLGAYLEEIAHADIPRLAEIRLDSEVIRHLLQSIARNVATEMSITTLRKDILTVAPSIQNETVAHLVGLLERVFVVESVPAWAPKLRSKARLRTSRKYHLADASLAAAALYAGAKTLREDPETLGFLFESAVIHDLTVMAEAMGGRLYHYRDSNGYEIDAVIQLPDGRWGAVEVKLGYRSVEGGIERLVKAVEQIDSQQPPSFMSVISGTGMTYTASNGVSTFPHLSLGFQRVY